MSHSNEGSGRAAVGRREFLKLVGAAGIAGTLPGAVSALAQAPAPAAPAAALADTTARAAAPSGPSEDALALAGILRRRFPDRLNDEQWAKVTRDLDSRLGSGRRLRELKLANGVEPDFTFRT